MKNKYHVCMYTRRWRFYPARLPGGTRHIHGEPSEDQEATWDEAYMVWREMLRLKGLLQAVLFRDEEPIRVFHHRRGEGRFETVDEPATGA